MGFWDYNRRDGSSGSDCFGALALNSGMRPFPPRVTGGLANRFPFSIGSMCSFFFKRCSVGCPSAETSALTMLDTDDLWREMTSL